MKHRGFTLIELLVVIAIIAILAAILFPVFAQAKAAAKKSASLSNTKQIGLGVIMYTNDVDDMFPMGSNGCWWQPLDGGWNYYVLPYIKNDQIFLSPMDPKSKATWPDWMRTTQGAVNMSYAANGYMKWDGSGWGMYGVIGMDQQHNQTRADGSCNATGWMSKGTTNGSQVTASASTIMLAERFGTYPVFGPSNFFTGINWWDYVGTGGEIPDGSQAGDGSYDTPRSGANYKVNGVTFTDNNKNGGMNATGDSKGTTVGKENVTWVDGHAGNVSPAFTNPDRALKPDKNLWDASRVTN